MPWESVVYKRANLYEEVWREPVRTVAKNYGISDVALAKICRKLEVPLPGRGYWARKAAGQNVSRPTLPTLKHGRPVQLNSARYIEAHERTPLEPDVARLLEAERDPSRAIVVAGALADPHPLVRMSAPILRRTPFGEQATQKERCLDMLVSKGTLDRALRVMDALLKALEARGFAIEVTEPENPEPLPRLADQRRPSRTGVRIGGQLAEFAISENSYAVEAPPPPRGSFQFGPRYEHQPNGTLALCLRGRAYSRTRQTWRDGKRQRVEDCLNDFVAALIATAEAKRLAAIEAEKERQRELAARREWEAAERQHEAHQVLVQDLNQRMSLLRKAQDIRTFAALVAASGLTDEFASEGSLTLADWLEWAHTRASRLERRALTGILTRKRDLSGRSALSQRFGWSAKVSSAALLDVVFNPYQEARQESEAAF